MLPQIILVLGDRWWLIQSAGDILAIFKNPNFPGRHKPDATAVAKLAHEVVAGNCAPYFALREFRKLAVVRGVARAKVDAGKLPPLRASHAEWRETSLKV